MGAGIYAASVTGGTLAGATFFGALGAAATAAAGATGAAILNAAGHKGYEVQAAAEMGAVGGAVLQGALGAVSGGITAGLVTFGVLNKAHFKSDDEKKSNHHKHGVSLVSYTAAVTLSGLVGYGILNSGDLNTAMELGQSAASFAVGGAVTAIPMGCALTCICVPLVLCGVGGYLLATESDKEIVQAVQNTPDSSQTTPRLSV